jgi:hypothetical protein
MADIRSTSPSLARRRTTALVGLALGSLLVLSACSSGDDSAATPSASVAASSDMPSAEASAAAPGVAELEPACLTYFELDLFNSDYAAGIVADGGMTEKQAKAEYLRLVKKLVADSDGVEGEGAEGAQRINANAKRMRTIIAGLAKKTDLGEIPTKKAAKLALQASRIQAACANNGYPLPDVNAQARSDAGVTAS